MMKEKIQALAAEYLPEVQKFRHHLHQIPELAGKEVQTSAAIRQKLSPLALELKKPYLETDVVALMQGSGPGRNITLRADIDALPFTEETGCPYQSRHHGIMHACGHDGHTAMLYGAALILNRLRQDFPGSVRFVFQPGEEMLAMAEPLIQAGVLENPHCDFAAALHAWPDVKYKCFSTRPGAVMAACGYFRLRLTARRHFTGTMAILGAEVITGIRKLWPADQKLVIARARADARPFTLPRSFFLESFIGFSKDSLSEKTEQALRQYLTKLASEHHFSWKLEFRLTYPLMMNSEYGARLANQVTEKYLGRKYVFPMKKTCLRSDDFAFFLQHTGGVYCQLGLGEHEPLHSPKFDFDDALLPLGMTFLAGLAVEFLNDRTAP